MPIANRSFVLNSVLVLEFLRKDRPWLIISGGFLLYTVYDIYDHISRPGSTFEANPFMWALFSLFSLLTVIAVMYLVTFVLDRAIKGYAVVKELTGLFVAVSFHILVTGPVYNALFWSADRLIFHYNAAAIFLLCGIYLLFRLVVFNGVRYLLKRQNRT